MKRATAIGGFVFLVHVLALGTFRVSLLLMLITGTGVLIWTVRRRSESFWRRLATASLLACLLASAQRRSDLSGSSLTLAGRTRHDDRMRFGRRSHSPMPQYCVYDSAHKDYLYTTAWIEKLIRELTPAAGFQLVVGRPTVPK